jgi:hypothetical protein
VLPSNGLFIKCLIRYNTKTLHSAHRVYLCVLYDSHNKEQFFLQWLFQPIQGPGLFFSSVIIFTCGRTPLSSDQFVARPLSKHRTTQTQNKLIHTPNIRVLSGIRTHDPSVRASDESSYLRPRGYCDRLINNYSFPKTKRLKTKLRGFSPQENYTDRATAACRRTCCQLLRIEGVAWSAQRIPTAVNLVF